MKWPKACLGEVAQVVSGATPKSSVDEYWDGNIPWITPADLSKLAAKEVSTTSRQITEAGLASCSSRILPARSVLLSSRAPIGHVAINAVPMATNQGFKSLVPDVDLITPDFLYWWLKTNTAYLQSLGRGATFKEVSKEIVESIEIPLPPLEEQRRIAAILDRAAFLNRRGGEVFAKIEQLERAVFEAYFGAHALEEYWEAGPLANFCALITDGEHQTPERTPSGIKLLSARNIRNGRLDLRKVDYVPVHEYERISRRCDPKRGDIFISCSGSIGRVSTYDSDDPVALVHSVALVRPLKAKLRPLFLEFLLRSPRLQALMKRAANASSQANLFQGPIKALQVFAPPLERQDAFIAEITSLRRLEARCHYRISRLNKLSASVMKQSFAS
jgi:type I restriction enzyme S subunit